MTLERSTVSRNNVVSKSLRDAPMKLLCSELPKLSRPRDRRVSIASTPFGSIKFRGTFRYMIVDVRVREATSYHQQSRARLTDCPSKLLLVPTERRRRCNFGGFVPAHY